MSSETPSSSTFALPPELLSAIIKLLSTEEKKAFSLMSRSARALVLPDLFGHLVYSGLSISPLVRNINNAGTDVKEAVRKVELVSMNLSIREEDDSRIIFEFLTSLPNLKSFEFRQFGQLITTVSFFELLDSIRHAPLLELALNAGYCIDFEGPISPGLPGLEKLSLAWNFQDSATAPGRSFEQLYELIRPSLTTLVSLSIENYSGKPGEDLDLQLLKPAGETLREFVYTLDASLDEGILQSIPELFPDLTKLSIDWSIVLNEHSILWKESHITPLSKLTNLTDLKLSCDFEQEAGDTVRADDDFPWFIRCYTRRLKATESITQAFPRLQRCTWIHHRIGRRVNTSMEHPFVVEEKEMDEGVVRRVRGAKQDWMGRVQEFWVTGDMVSCLLEDLPGDVIGENDPPEEEEE